MAKSKSFFGLRTGSTKSLTFSVYRGNQITKDRVTRVANPRTVAQMQQRAKVPLVAAARVALAGLVDHSFEGVPYGQASLQKFSSLNLSNGVLNVASYPPNGVSNMGCADFIVSAGSLLNPFVNNDAGQYGVGVISLPTLGTEKIFPAMPKGTKGSTVLYFANKALAHNPSWKPNSQLTSLCIANQFNYVINEQGGGSLNRSVPLFTPFIQRFVFPGSYPTGEQTVDELANYHDDNDYWKLSQAVPEGGADDVVLEGPNGESLIFKFQYHMNCQVTLSCGSDGKTIVASCLIFSQLDGLTWKRSNSRIAIDFEGNLKSITPFTFSDWLQAYSKTIVNTKYLNTGNASTGISGQNATGISGQRSPRMDLGPAGVNAATGISGQRPPQSDVERADGNAATGNSDQNG